MIRLRSKMSEKGLRRAGGAALGAVEELPWPFAFVVGERGEGTGWIALHAPIVSPGRSELFASLRRSNARFVGFTSDGRFPADPSGPLDYFTLCEAWCHCLARPAAVFPAETPLALLSDSDFTDPSRVRKDRFQRGSGFDIVHVSAAPGWKRQAKNGPLGRACLTALAGASSLSCLAVGIEEDEELARAGIVCVPELPWEQLMAELASARLLLVASVEDASPRILAEALCLDTPILVNRAILGGWKYVNAFTGRFFSSADDVAAAAAECLAGTFHPRSWFAANHGPANAGRRLARLLSSLDPSLAGHGRLALAARLSATGRH